MIQVYASRPFQTCCSYYSHLSRASDSLTTISCIAVSSLATNSWIRHQKTWPRWCLMAISTQQLHCAYKDTIWYHKRSQDLELGALWPVSVEACRPSLQWGLGAEPLEGSMEQSPWSWRHFVWNFSRIYARTYCTYFWPFTTIANTIETHCRHDVTISYSQHAAENSTYRRSSNNAAHDVSLQPLINCNRPVWVSMKQISAQCRR